MEMLDVLENRLSVANLDSLQTEALEIINHLSAIAVSPTTLKSAEALRTDSNKWAKDIRAKLKECEDEYLKPFKEAEAMVLKIVEPVEAKAKAYAQDILEVKKRERHDEARYYFEQITKPSEDGEIPYAIVPDFEAIYAEIPAKFTKAEVHKAIEAGVESYQKKSYTAEIKASGRALEKLMSYAKALNVEVTIK